MPTNDANNSSCPNVEEGAICNSVREDEVDGSVSSAKTVGHAVIRVDMGEERRGAPDLRDRGSTGSRDKVGRLAWKRGGCRFRSLSKFHVGDNSLYRCYCNTTESS